MRSKALITGLAGLLIGALAAALTLWLPSPSVGPGGAPVSTGAAKIGGPFTLIDQDGKARTDKDFRGRHMLVFFGFLYCPDICPAALQVVTEALERLGPKAKRIVPIFVTIDPERDTPAALKDYLSNFHPQLIGLTGSLEQIGAAAKAYRVYYKKRDAGDLPGAYTMDHSTILYLMGADGRYVSHFTHSTSAKDMAKRLKSIL